MPYLFVTSCALNFDALQYICCCITLSRYVVTSQDTVYSIHRSIIRAYTHAFLVRRGFAFLRYFACEINYAYLINTLHVLHCLVLYIGSRWKLPKSLEIDGIQDTESVFQCPGNGGEQWSFDRRFVPALVDEVVNNARDLLRHLQQAPAHNVLHHLCV